MITLTGIKCYEPTHHNHQTLNFLLKFLIGKGQAYFYEFFFQILDLSIFRSDFWFYDLAGK